MNAAGTAVDQIIYGDDSSNLRFYTNATERMRVTSGGSVGIGTTSADGLAHVYNGMLQVGSKTGDTSIQQNANAIRIAAIPNSSTEWGGLQWYREFSDVIGAEIIASRPSSAETDTDLIFKTSTNSSNAVEVARITHSGNVLVGHTGSIYNNINATSTVGSSYSSNGEIFACSSESSGVMFLNRKTTDGAIATFRKDGTTVGSIGSRGSGTSFIILKATSGAGAGLTGSDNRILPMDESALADNNTDLGMSSYRFKDLYLGGGAYIGGTGAANYLDDYEEGTWTPTFQNVTTPTYTEQTGIYTKVGRLVHLYIKLNYSGLDTTDASSLAINLPYTASAGGAFHLIQSNSSTGYTGTNTLSFIGSVGVSASVITFGSNTSYDDGDYDSGNFAASGILHFAGVYITS